MENHTQLSTLHSPFTNDGYLLLVEDGAIIQTNNKDILTRRGHAIRLAYSLAEAREAVKEAMPRAIVLDIQLPDGSGLDFLRELRESSTVPVLMLTAMGTPQDIVKGLESGGDDYLAKPYDLSVFLTRVEALLRRASLIPDTLAFGPLRLDTVSGIALMDGQDMLLTRKEYSLLQLFVQNPEKRMSAEYLYEKVWRQDMAGDDGAVKNAVYKLRKKLQGSGYTISSERGEGYCIGMEDARSAP